MKEMNIISTENEELVGASGIACTLACGTICILASAALGMYYASIATVL